MKLKKLTFKEAASENPLDWSEMRKIKGGVSPTTPVPIMLHCWCKGIPGIWDMIFISESHKAQKIAEYCDKQGGYCIPNDGSGAGPEPSPVTA